jgi:hypothetical protein
MESEAFANDKLLVHLNAMRNDVGVHTSDGVYVEPFVYCPTNRILLPRTTNRDVINGPWKLELVEVETMVPAFVTMAIALPNRTFANVLALLYATNTLFATPGISTAEIP